MPNPHLPAHGSADCQQGPALSSLPAKAPHPPAATPSPALPAAPGLVILAGYPGWALPPHLGALQVPAPLPQALATLAHECISQRSPPTTPVLVFRTCYMSYMHLVN